jgi:MFS superfamily sulfate permease-like transporter
VSVGLMNLIAFCFGGMPMCHGAGGLAGQYRFGARTNGSILLLGAMKMAVAVLLGGTLMAFCRVFPASILGIMVAVSGLELGLSARDQTQRDDAYVMLLTTGACLGLNNIALGFGLGLALTLCLRFIASRRETEIASA